MVVQILLGLGFLLSICATVYAKINKTRRQKVAPKQSNINQKSTVGQTRIISRIASVAGHLIFVLVILNIFLFGYISQYIPRLDFSFLSATIQLIGFIITIIGCGLLFVSFRTLGANWIDSNQRGGRIPLPAEQELVQTGIYNHIRNPIYLGMYFIIGGWTFLLLDGLMLILFFMYVIGMYFLVLDEEKTLLDHFGDQYSRYLQQTGRFFPKLKRS